MPEDGPDHDLTREEQLAILRKVFRDQDPTRSEDVDPDLQFIRDELPGYTIEEEIGSGGQGKVYSGFKNGNPRSVAIKVLLNGPFADRRQLKRFDREIDLVSNLKHPGIIEVYDSGTIKGRPYLIMEFVHGLKITEHADAEFFDVRERIELFLHACEAVSAAHAKGIVHRDLKPSNIMVDAAGRVRLLDFGLAKDLTQGTAGSSELSLTEGRVGTAKYSSPEQIIGRPASVQSDVYSLGVVLFELLSTVLPYEGSELRGDVERALFSDRLSLREAVEDNPYYTNVKPIDISRNLEAVLDTAMAKEPDLRYATVDEFAQDLRRYLKGEEVKAHSAVGHRIRNRFSKAYRRKFAAAAVIALVATSALVAVIARQRSQEAERAAHAIIGVAAFVRMAERDTHASEFDRAKATLLEAIALSEAIPPLDSEGYRPVYTAYHELADLAFRSKDLEAARTYSQQAISIVDTMRREFPSDSLWFRLEGFSHKLRGRIAYAEEDWSTALGHFERMLDVRDELLVRSPSLVGHQVEVVNACTWVGKAARHNEQLAYAIEILNRAVEINTTIAGDYPGGAVHLVRLSRSENDLGVALMSQRTTYGNAEAKKWLTSGRARLSALLDENSLGSRKNDATKLLTQIDHNLNIINNTKPAESVATPS